MALATRCPHCNTTFRVVEDQLKLYSGIVRCGVCHEIFNATDHIVDDSELAKPGAAVPPRDNASTAPAAAQPENLAPEPSSSASEVNQPPAPETAEPVRPDEPPAVSAPPALIEPTPPSPFEAPKEPAATPVQGSSEDAGDNDERIELDIPEQPFSDAEQPPAFLHEIDDLSIEDLSEKILREGKYDPMAAEGLQPFENTASRLHEEDWKSISLDLGSPPEPEAAPPQAEPPRQVPSVQSEPISPPEFDSHIASPAQHESALGTSEAPPPPAEVPQPAQSGSEDYVVSLSNDKVLEPDTEITDPEPKQPHEPGFVKRAKRQQRLSRTMRWLLSLGSLVLLVLLVLQGVYAFHDRIVALMPDAEPAVAEICGVLDCETRLTAKIDELSIDSHELQSLPNRPDTYTLDVVLHNISSSTQEWPHLELTLNDESGQPSIRRVFTPETYLSDLPESANVSISKGFAPQSEQQIKLVFTLDQVKAAGYRVYIFYP